MAQDTLCITALFYLKNKKHLNCLKNYKENTHHVSKRFPK